MSQNNFTIQLIENLSLLLNHFKLIEKTPELYFIPVPDCRISSAYVARKRTDLFLGELLTLWNRGEWMAECPECGSPLYLTGIGGSLLSGNGSGWGICSGCLKFKSGIKPFGKYFRQGVRLPVFEIPENTVFVSLEELMGKLNNED